MQARLSHPLSLAIRTVQMALDSTFLFPPAKKRTHSTYSKDKRLFLPLIFNHLTQFYPGWRKE